MQTIETWLPNFPGFYNSILDSQIDMEMEMEIDNLMESDINITSDDAFEKVDQRFDYSKARLAISQGYLEVWSEIYNVPAKFKEINSPREYNFTTDRLLIEVDKDFMMKLGERCLTGDLESAFQDILSNWFTSYDGFISFYSNDMDDDEWTDLELYDENQWSAVLAAYMEDSGEEMEYDDHRIFEAAQEGWIA